MWIIQNEGQAPQILSNNAEDKIGRFVRRDYPEAAIYVCREPAAFARMGEHTSATHVVYHDEERQEPQIDGEGNPVLDEEGNPVTLPVTVPVPERVSLGNTVAIDPDGPALQLLNASGEVVGTLPLQLVP